MRQPFTLVLNASPNPGGHTMRLADAVLAHLPGEWRVVHLYREAITPCLACGCCAEGGACPLPDSMPALVGALAACDFLLLASPLHFTSLTAPLIAFFSRLQPFWQAGKRGIALLPPKRRIAGLAVTAGAEYRDMFRPARSVAAAACNSIGAPLAGMATAANTDTLPVEQNPAALGEAAALAKAMLERGGCQRKPAGEPQA